MASIEEILTTALSEDSYRLWTKCWTAVASRVMARGIIDCLDFVSGRMSRSLPPVNDDLWRVQTIGVAVDAAALSEDELMGYFDLLNGVVTSGSDGRGRPYDKRTRPGMRRFLRPIIGDLMFMPITSGVLATIPAVEIWRATAHELGRMAYAGVSGPIHPPDSVLHNQLLIAAYFWACTSSNENEVARDLTEFSNCILSLQGTLVDIVERVSSNGVIDERPRTAVPVAFSLATNARSPLLDLLVQEAQSVASGGGFVMRWLGTIPTNASIGVDPSFMQELRQATYLQYEYSVLAFMALSGIEQLLRAFAQKIGLFEGNQRFTPARLAMIVQALGGDVDVAGAIDTIYDGSRGNLRNRILHGAQLQIERARRRATLSIAAPSSQPVTPDVFAPQNVFLLCFGSLRLLDERISKVVTITSNDFGWTQHFTLTAQETLVAKHVHYDFSGDEGKVWWDRIDNFLTALTPNIKILFNAGFVGWIDRRRQEKFVLFMALNMVLEALFRVVVRLQQDSILKLGAARAPDQGAIFRYKMLDRNEFCAPDTLDRLVEGVDPHERQVAKTIITLAVKVRDAVAHGAIVALGMDEGIEMGHLLVKAIQCLVESGEHEMIKTAAYYRWKVFPHEGAKGNWLAGEQEILRQIGDAVQLRDGV